MASAGSILGNAVHRLEDPTLLTGEGKYFDDLVETDMLHVALVRSAVAHGDLVSVDVSDAESMPGVVAVYHSGGDDLGLPPMQGFAMMPEVFNQPVFAVGKVRFVGDVVAAVVADGRGEVLEDGQLFLMASRPVDVARELYEWAKASDKLGSVYTVLELYDADAADDDCPCRGSDPRLVFKALGVLEDQDRCQVFHGATSSDAGVKFFRE